MRRIVALLLLLFMLPVFSACGSSDATTDNASVEATQSSVASVSTPAAQEQAEPEENADAEKTTTSAQEDQPEPIILTWNELGEYGKETTLNANTDMPYTFIEFHIPVGTYQVTNNDDKSVQVSINNDGINITEEGWEEPKGEAGNCIVLMPGDEGELTVEDGQYVKLTDHSENIYFVRTGD